INVNETHVYDNGYAKVKFHIHNLKDENNNKIDGTKNVYYKIFVNGKEVYDGKLENAVFQGGNLNNIVVDILGKKGDNWKVVAIIDSVVVESQEKKLN
ncbi:MAG: hypothetical protein GX045_00145, partial [Clostridiaceae bacterium]|nr:hypothetical protein [Clostridiaceae bacterium]